MNCVLNCANESLNKSDNHCHDTLNHICYSAEDANNSIPRLFPVARKSTRNEIRKTFKDILNSLNKLFRSIKNKSKSILEHSRNIVEYIFNLFCDVIPVYCSNRTKSKTARNHKTDAKRKSSRATECEDQTKRK